MFPLCWSSSTPVFLPLISFSTTIFLSCVLKRAITKNTFNWKMKLLLLLLLLFFLRFFFLRFFSFLFPVPVFFFSFVGKEKKRRRKIVIKFIELLIKIKMVFSFYFVILHNCALYFLFVAFCLLSRFKLDNLDIFLLWYRSRSQFYMVFSILLFTNPKGKEKTSFNNFRIYT